MAKYYGTIGFSDTKEVKPGVWKNDIVEEKYYGDVVESSRMWRDINSKANDDIAINVKLSILGNQFAYEHVHAIKYAEYMNSYWKVTSINVLYPRVVLTLGGVYNGKQTDTAD